jgi:hypothetical protein
MSDVNDFAPFVIPPSRADVGATYVHHRHEKDGAACLACLLEGQQAQLAEARAEVERRRALAEATQLECNRLAADFAAQQTLLETRTAEVARLRVTLGMTATAREIAAEHALIVEGFGRRQAETKLAKLGAALLAALGAAKETRRDEEGKPMTLHNEKPDVERLDGIARRVVAAAVKFERKKHEANRYGDTVGEGDELCAVVIEYNQAVLEELIGPGRSES